MRLTLFLIVVLCFALFAGGPIQRVGTQATPHDTSRPMAWRLDGGELNITFPRDRVKEIVREQFAAWDSVPGSNLRLVEGEDVPNDITDIAGIEAVLADGVAVIALDETGTIFEDFGIDPNSTTIAFAAPFEVNRGDGKWDTMFAVIGGNSTTGSSDNAVATVVLHEIGHGVGLGHSVVNAHISNTPGATYEDFGRPSNFRHAEVMHYLLLSNTTPVLKADDISGFLALHGDGITGNPASGKLSGRIFREDASAGYNGINVIARDRSGGVDTVWTNAASGLSFSEEGYWEIPGLPPGQYSVEIIDIGRSANTIPPSYSEPVRTNFLVSAEDKVGPFPGDEEFWNFNESHRPELDNVMDRTEIQLEAGQHVENINFIINRAPDIKGTNMQNIYHIAEVQVDENAETYVGVVNNNGISAAAEITGFAADGSEIVPELNMLFIPARGKADFTVSERFGANAAQVDWLQVGSGSTLHVYGELRNTETRAGWWAGNGFDQNAYMPHVAQDTATFETVLASVNGKDQALTTTLTTRPGQQTANLNAQLFGFGQENNRLTDYFGDDLSNVEWGLLESDQQAAASMEYFVAPLDTRSRMAALGLTSESGTGLRFLHIASDVARFWTGLLYINVSDAAANATETYYDTTGAVLSTVPVTLAPGEKITRILFQGIDPSQGGVPEGSAWMEVTIDEGSGGELVGYELFSSPDPNVQDIFAALQGNYQQGLTLIYPHFQSNASQYTAIVATNVGDDAANLTVELFNRDGDVVATNTINDVAPNSKRALLINDGFFGGVDTSSGAWLRVTASGSAWAGFELWGDIPQGSPPRFISGINAALENLVVSNPGGGGGGGGTGVRAIINEQEDNNSYDAAMELTADENGVWDINVIGSIAQSDSGSIINNYTGCGNLCDDVEDVYSFTLTQPTPLVIALNPDNGTADLDLFVFSEQRANGNFFINNPELSDTVDYSAAAGGRENVARVFQPGTYYILVTLFEGDFTNEVEYGLLVSQQPIYLETFDANPLADWNFLVDNADTDSQSEWAWLNLFDTELKYGSGLVQLTPPNAGEQESSLAVSPFIDVPAEGVTIFDYDISAINSAPLTSGDGIFTSILDTDFVGLSTNVFGPSFANAVAYSLLADGQTYNLFPFVRFGSIFDENQQSDFTFPAGQRLAIGIWGQSTTSFWYADNVRVFTMQTSATPGKNKQNAFIQNVRRPKVGFEAMKPQSVKPTNKAKDGK